MDHWTKYQEIRAGEHLGSRAPGHSPLWDSLSYGFPGRRHFPRSKKATVDPMAGALV